MIAGFFGHKKSFHCGYCQINWPLDKDYSMCPLCTSRLIAHKADPISQREAQELIRKTRDLDEFTMIISNGDFTTEEYSRIRELEGKLLSS